MTLGGCGRPATWTGRWRSSPVFTPAKTETSEARWAHAEWLSLVKRRFGERELVLYSQGKGRAAALSPRDDGTLEVLAALGMRWQPGKMLSRRSLRGLRTMGGESWS